MSHWSGQVLLGHADDLVGYFRYNGTCDCLASTKIYATEDDLIAEWRFPWTPPCKCEGVPAVLRTYDGRLNWRANVCLDHCTITFGYEPTYENTIEQDTIETRIK